eukprot:GEMP01064886.1.p1 GENE.GEMP01064886.1~~GEMP01064886.1.p1  ORF type:complete len:258 (+),score=54.82 GEMP01064886.1:52-825(+)
MSFMNVPRRVSLEDKYPGFNARDAALLARIANLSRSDVIMLDGLPQMVKTGQLLRNVFVNYARGMAIMRPQTYMALLSDAKLIDEKLGVRDALQIFAMMAKRRNDALAPISASKQRYGDMIERTGEKNKRSAEMSVVIDRLNYSKKREALESISWRTNTIGLKEFVQSLGFVASMRNEKLRLIKDDVASVTMSPMSRATIYSLSHDGGTKIGSIVDESPIVNAWGSHAQEPPILNARTRVPHMQRRRLESYDLRPQS